MEYPHKPEVVTFQGEEAKKILEEYIRELEEHKPDELTAAQAEAMTRVARGLIAVIDDEPPAPPSKRQHSYFPTIVQTLKDHLPHLAREENQTYRVSEAEKPKDSHNQPLPLNQHLK